MEIIISTVSVVIAAISLWLSIKNLKTQKQTLLQNIVIEQFKTTFQVKRCLIRDNLFLEVWVKEDNKLVLMHKQLCLMTDGSFKDPDADIGNMHGYLGQISTGSKTKVLKINDKEVDLQMQASVSADSYMKKLENYYKTLC